MDNFSHFAKDVSVCNASVIVILVIVYEQGGYCSHYLTPYYILNLFYKNEGPNGPLIGRLVSELYKRANALLIERLVSMNILRGLTPSL